MTDFQPYPKEYQLRDAKKEPHPRGCSCKPCLGRRSRASGKRKQNMARKALGIPNPRFRTLTANEEAWGGSVRCEVKSGAACTPAWTRFLLCERQSDANKAVGDVRPFVAVLMAKDSSDGLVQFRLSKIRETVAALSEQLWDMA